MRDRNGYTTLQMLIVIGVLGIFTLAMIGTTSYAYKDKTDEYYDEKIHLIIKQAELYGMSGPKADLLKKEGKLNITVNDLVKDDYFVADDKEGNVVDPRNSKANLNNKIIILTYKDKDNIKAEIMEED